LQQEGEAAVITAPAPTATAAIAKKEKKIVQTSIISAHNNQKWSF